MRELGPEVRPWGEVRWSPVKASRLRPHGNSWNMLRSREKYFCKPAVLNGTWVGRRSGPPHLNLAMRHNGKESACQCRRHRFNPCIRRRGRRSGNPLQYSCLEILGPRSLVG